ncbi:hypothetical protein PBC5_086 [Bacillus phage PBC5]|nr:hypothetical protein PBC5_086 [Bacillus phage PBC5]
MALKVYKGYDHKARMKGQRIIDKAVAEGRYPKAAYCTACGQQKGRLDYHADDYTPETILEHTRVLCFNCHMTHHILYGNPNDKGAQLYEQRVREGKRFLPCGTFQKLKAVHKWLIEEEKQIETSNR